MYIDGDAFLGIIYPERLGEMWLLLGRTGSCYDFPIFGWRYLRMHTVRRNRG